MMGSELGIDMDIWHVKGQNVGCIYGVYWNFGKCKTRAGYNDALLSSRRPYKNVVHGDTLDTLPKFEACASW
jgi:hypothetical protein